MADKSYAAFRDAVLEGTDPDGRDHPTARARSALQYFDRADRAAQDAVDGAEVALEKAQDAVDAASRNLAEAKKTKTAAKRDLEHAREVVKDAVSEHGESADGAGEATDVPAGAGEGTGA